MSCVISGKGKPPFTNSVEKYSLEIEGHETGCCAKSLISLQTIPNFEATRKNKSAHVFAHSKWAIKCLIQWVDPRKCGLHVQGTLSKGCALTHICGGFHCFAQNFATLSKISEEKK